MVSATVVSLHDYRQEKDMEGFKWKGEDFHISGDPDLYYDLATRPIFFTPDAVTPARKEIVKAFPKQVGRDMRPHHSKMFMPFFENGDPLLYLAVDNVSVNSTFEPLSLMHLVIRDHYVDFYKMVDGAVIASLDDYKSLRREFNTLFSEILLKGHVKQRSATLDEVIRLSAMLYKLLKTADMYEGPILSNKSFTNRWAKEPKSIALGKDMSAYSAKLKNVSFTGMDWFNYIQTHMDEVDETSFFLVNMPSLNSCSTSFSKSDIFYFLDMFVYTIHSKGADAMLTIGASKQVFSLLRSSFGFKKYKGDRWRKDFGGDSDLTLYMSLLDCHNGHGDQILMVTTYNPEKGNFKRGFTV